MTALDHLDEQKAVRLRQRLWGAAVLIALLVIFLPLLLDGAGSESQYRRVESLRAEPPRILDQDGVPEAVDMTSKLQTEIALDRSNATIRVDASVVENTPGVNSLNQGDAGLESSGLAGTALVSIAETRDSLATPKAVPAPRPKPARPTTSRSTEPLTAWVVQAGSFGEEANALAVRDKLRRAGFPSFVTPTESATPMYRVRVGPMINLQQAEANRNKVIRLLDREAIVVSYP